MDAETTPTTKPTSDTDDRDPPRRRRLLPALLVFALAAATVAIGASGALFTDTQTFNNSIATGTVNLQAGQNDPLPWNITDMAPADTDGPVPVTVSNNGTLELRYAITSEETSGTSPDLANQLVLSIWAEAQETNVDSTCEVTGPSDLSNVTTFRYQGALGTASSTTNLVGDPSAGNQTGDETLAASSSELLCFHLELPSTTGNSYQDVSTTVDLNFVAEQTSSNP